MKVTLMGKWETESFEDILPHALQEVFTILWDRHRLSGEVLFYWSVTKSKHGDF